MNLTRRVERLEREATKNAVAPRLATVLITDADGADFLATPGGERYAEGDALVIVKDAYGKITPEDATALHKLTATYGNFCKFELNGYDLRLIDRAYQAALAREGVKQNEKS